MRFVLITSALSASLVACQGATSLSSVPAAASSVAARVAGARAAYEVCGERGFGHLDKAGGVQKVPHIAKLKQFEGRLGYAALNVNGPVQGLMFSCPTSDPIAPTPQGYTSDWFGSWTLYCKGDESCTGLTFADANATGSIISNVWVASRTYYLYVYSLDTRQFIESYQIGPVTPGKNGRSSIAFDSPFENGLAYPANEGYGLTIVHPN